MPVEMNFGRAMSDLYMVSTGQQQNANMLFLEAAAASAVGSMSGLLGTVSANGELGSEILDSSKAERGAVPSASVTAEVIATGSPNIVFNNEDGVIRRHDRRLKGRFAANGKAVTVGEHVVNLLN
ncbi:unnamed protein product, partial [Gongylonema pulchrum]|uniref:Structural protein n=1 Tax=Gongylonema pulchrum TaxID=637853 RepID=A0A183F057_9BILA